MENAYYDALLLALVRCEHTLQKVPADYHENPHVNATLKKVHGVYYYRTEFKLKLAKAKVATIRVDRSQVADRDLRMGQ